MGKGTEEIAQLSVGLSLEAQSFTKQMTTINKQIKQADKDFKSAGQGVVGFENTFVGLASKMQKTTKQIDLYNTKLGKQKEAFKQMEGTLSANKKKLDEIEQTQGKGSKAWKDQAKLVQQNAEKLTSLDSNINTTEGNIKRLASELQDTQKSFQKLSKQTKSTEEQLEEITRQADLSESEFGRLGSELQGTGNYFKRLGNDMNAMSSKITAGTQKIGVYENKIEELGRTLNKNKTDHTKLGNEIDKLERDLAESERTFGKNSQEAEKLRRKLYELKDTYNRLDREIDEGERSLDEYQRELNNTQREVNELGRELRNMPFERIGQDLQNIGGKVSAVGSTMSMYVTTPLIGVAAAATKVGVEFDRTMSKVSAITGATGNDFESLKDKAMELGNTTKYSSNEIAEAMTFMGMAGYDTKQILESVNGVVSLSIAGNVNLAKASDIVTDSLTGMQLSAKDCGDFVDIMASTITNSNTSVELMGETMKYVAPVAGALGITMQDLSLAIGLAGNAGIKGSQSGTALRGGLTRLVEPTTKAKAAMDKYGIALQKNEDGTVNLKDTLVHLREKMGKLDATTQASAASTIFGKEAMSSWMAIINASDDDFQNLRTNINGSTKVMTFFKEGLEQSGKEGKELEKSLSKLNEVYDDNKMLADAMNLSSTDLGTAIALLGNDGKVATKNVEGLLSAVFDMQNPTKETKQAMDDLGFEVARLSDGSLDLNSTLGNLRTAMAGMSEEEKKALIESLNLKGGQEDLLEILSLTDDEFKNTTEAMNDTKGASEKLAEIMGENLGKEIDEMKSSLQTSLIKVFETLEPLLASVVEKITDMANWFNNLTDAEREQVIMIAGVVACIGPLLVVVGNLVSFMGSLTLVMGGTTLAGGSLATVLGGLSTVALPVLIAALVLLATTLGDSENAIYKLQERFGSLGTIVGGVCEFISGAVQLTFGNLVNLLMLVFDLIAAALDGPGGATMEEAFDTFGTRMANTTEEAMQKVALSSTRAMSQLRNATDEQLNGTVQSMDTILGQLPSIIDGNYSEATNALSNQLQNMDASQLTILKGMNDSTEMIFKEINENMTVDQMKERLELNFKQMKNTGQMDAETLEKNVSDAMELMKMNMDVKTEEGAKEVTDNIAKASQEVKNKTDKINKDATENFDKASKGAKKGSDKIKKETTDNLDKTAKNTDTKSKEIANNLEKNMKDGAKKADNEVKGFSKSTEKNVSDANRNLKQSSTDMYKGVCTSFAMMEKKCKQSATNMYKGVKTSAAMMAKNARQSASDMYNGVTTSTRLMANKAISDWQRVRDEYSKGIKGTITKKTIIQKPSDEETYSTLQAMADNQETLRLSNYEVQGSYYNTNTSNSNSLLPKKDDSASKKLIKELQKAINSISKEDKKIQLEVPLYLDGRELTRVIKEYSDEDNKRDARMRGDW